MQTFERLEIEIAKWIGNSNVVVCSSGTSALHIALESLELPLGSEVIVPEFTMVACARAVTLAGLKPVFADCNAKDLLVNPNKIKKAISKNTAAIMPVHIYGRRCDMSTITEIAKEYNLAIVEDMAEIHGVPPSPLSDAACWSFYRNKIVAGEEGGAIAFKDRKKTLIARQLRCQGFTENHDFLHRPRGINARLSNANAELILDSLMMVNENLMERSQIERWYNEAIPKELRMPKRLVCWVYDIKLENVDTASVVALLNQDGISARLGFKPMSMQPEYARSYKWLQAFKQSKKIIYLPIVPGMDRDKVDWVADALERSIRVARY